VCYLTDSGLLWKMGLLSSAMTKGSDGSMELVMAVEEASRTTAGGENSCGVARPVLRHPFKRAEWCKAVHRGMELPGGGYASMQCQFSAIDGSDGVGTVSR
jgi:hypothetical protein